MLVIFQNTQMIRLRTVLFRLLFIFSLSFPRLRSCRTSVKNWRFMQIVQMGLGLFRSNTHQTHTYNAFFLYCYRRISLEHEFLSIPHHLNTKQRWRVCTKWYDRQDFIALTITMDNGLRVSIEKVVREHVHSCQILVCIETIRLFT